MPTTQPTDINSRRGRKGGATSKKDALTKLGANDDGFTAGKENPNIRPEDEAKPKRRTYKPKQEQLIDTAPEVHPAVQAAAEKYLEVLDARMELMSQEPQLRSGLIDLMVHHNVTHCRINDEVLELETIRKIKKKNDKPSE